MKKNKNKKTMIILLVLCVGLVGITIAYFSNSATLDNLFSTKEYGTTYTEEFVSPSNWLPGDTTDKTVTVTNSGQVDEAVRISYTEEWKSNNGTTLSGLIDEFGKLTDIEENSEKAAIINFNNTDDWTYNNGYYYYNYRLQPGEETSSFIESVTFNPKVTLGDTCTETESNGKKTITCNSSGDDYDNATYKLTLKIETVQYNKYKEAWTTGVDILNYRPITFLNYIMSKKNEDNITNYADGNKSEMYTFDHEETEQTDALTDYRYIGDSPNNYVYFNCKDLSNQNEDTCEIWRIVGVFDVDNGTGNYEQRIKLVRGSAFPTEMKWNSIDNDNSWNNASLNMFLNGDYYNGTGEAEYFGLNESTREMIDDAKYYLGIYKNGYPYSNEKAYNSERSRVVYNNIPIEWTGKVGLMYPSDILFTTIDNKGWIFNSNIRQGQTNIQHMWLLSHAYNESAYGNFIATVAFLDGSIHYFYEDYLATTNSANGIRPVVYINPNIYIIDGNGSEGNPYNLSLQPNMNISNQKYYKDYNVGDEVTYKNELYYVIKNSSDEDKYVRLLKALPLTQDIINLYNSNYTSTNGEYPYLENDNCNNNNKLSCNTNYYESSIKEIIDDWASQYDSDLVKVGGYKSRLLFESEIIDDFKYESYYDSPNTNYRASDDTPEWVYISGKPYWTMSQFGDSNLQVYGVGSVLSQENIYNKLYVRPVINLKKCAITNTCE